MPIGRIIPASQISSLPAPPVRWHASPCERPDGSYAGFLRRANAAVRPEDSAAFSSSPLPFAVALREQNVEDRRAESRAQADAPSATYPAPKSPRARTPSERIHDDPSSMNNGSPHASARPIVPPICEPAAASLAATYRLVLPLARGLVIDLLA